MPKKNLPTKFVEKYKASKPALEQEHFNIQLEKLRLKEKEVELKEGLPFKYGWKWYNWARIFFESVNKLNFLCAANQISKSSTQIRKAIDWGTDQDKWPRLWGKKPTQFWYLYPSRDIVDIEFKTKWAQFLPRGKYKDDPIYGWKEIKKNKGTWGIQFNSGVLLVFKTYGQDTEDLQAGTVDAVFCDEELPVEHYQELMQRISASDGYFHMVFTATLGQQFWHDVIEEKGEREKLKGALKLQVSVFECMFYEDGTPSHWTEAKVAQAIARCATHAEVERRIRGRFVKDSGLKYPTFSWKKHFIPDSPVPAGWHIYGAADSGSGGEKGHPAAIVFVAVRPDYRKARIFRGWRGDKIVTTSSDIIEKFVDLRGNLTCIMQLYDWADKDFEIIATRMGEGFVRAEKSHMIGENLINVLFKNDMLEICDTPELQKLGAEFASLDVETAKRKAEDDFIDAARYALSKIPFDLSHLPGSTVVVENEKEAKKTSLELRRERFLDDKRESQELEEEFQFWNDMYG